MEKRNIITGQKIDPGKLARAKELRKNMTPAEKCLWDALRGNKLDGFHFRRQQIIDGLIVDFYCHKAGLVVEVDGPVHDMQKEYDQVRTDHLIGRGLVVLRFRNEEVMQDLAGVFENNRATCRERVETGAARTYPPSPSPMRGGAGGGVLAGRMNACGEIRPAAIVFRLR